MIPPNRSILLRSIVKETETKQARQDKNEVKQRKATRTEKSNKIESCVCSQMQNIKEINLVKLHTQRATAGG